MKTNLALYIFLMGIITVFTAPQLRAADRRTMPLDLYLIIDSSEGFSEARDETVAWINEQVIDRLLQEGDRLVIWSAGPSARLIHSETVGARKDDAKNKVRNLEISGKTPDFTGALREASARANQENPDGKRISYTLLVSASAENLAPAIERGSAGLFRWFRTEKYARWQALVADPNINQKVRQAAASYMSGR